MSFKGMKKIIICAILFISIFAVCLIFLFLVKSNEYLNIKGNMEVKTEGKIETFGKKVVVVGKENESGIKVGEDCVLAIPDNTKTKRKSSEDIEKQKEDTIQLANELNATGKIAEQKGQKGIEYDDEIPTFDQLLKKYYDNAIIDELNEKIKEETYGLQIISKIRKLSENQIKLFNIAIDVTELDNIEEDDKLLLVGKILDLNIKEKEDKELYTRIENLKKSFEVN